MIRISFKSAIFVVVFTTTSLLLSQDAKQPELPNEWFNRLNVRAEVKDKAREEATTFFAIWNGRGNVVVGKLDGGEKLDPARVGTRTHLFDDGAFAAAVYPNRTLRFLAHGYAPIDVRVPRNATRVYDVGTIRAIPLNPDALTQVEGTITASAPVDNELISVRLMVGDTPPIWMDQGSECGDHSMPVVGEMRVRSGETFRFDKMSQFAYGLSIQYPRHIGEFINLEVKRSQKHRLEPITLRQSPILRFRYATSFRSDKRSALREQTIECNGENTFVMTEETDDLGNKMQLHLLPEADGISAHFGFGQTLFYDLGSGDLQDVLTRVSAAEIRQTMRPMDETKLGAGRVYFMECEWQRISCLFNFTELSK